MPTAINKAGTIAGNAAASNAGNAAASRGSQAQHAFVYDAAFHDLGVLPGFTTSQATGINASGVVVGLCGGGSGTVSFRHSGTGPLPAADALGALPAARALSPRRSTHRAAWSAS